MIPAPVSQTAMKIEQSCASRMLDDVLRTFRYCKISGTDMRRRARRNRNPIGKGGEREKEREKKDKLIEYCTVCVCVYIYICID